MKVAWRFLGVIIFIIGAGFFGAAIDNFTHHHHKPTAPSNAWTNPNNFTLSNITIGAASKNDPTWLPVKEYTITVYGGYQGTSSAMDIQVVKIPHVGRCVIVSTIGVWCE